MSKSLYLPLNVGLEEAELEGFTTASQALGSRNSLEFVNNSLSTIQTFFSRMIQLDPEENELFGETGRDINGFRLTTEDEPPGLDHDTAISIRSDHISNLSIQSGKAASSAAGTATGGSATTLVDSGRSWTVDEWKDATLKIVDATDGALYFVTVTDNDATSFTFVTPGITVASSDTYQVVKNSSDCLLNMGSWNAVGGTWGVNGALRIDMSNNNAFSMESNYGKITFDNNSTTKRLTADVSNLKIQSGTQPYAEFQNMETSNPALFFFDGGSDPSTPSNGAVVYAKSGDLYRRKSDGTISAWATGGGSGTIDEAADYSMTGTWSFSPVSGKSVPSFQPYASGTPFTIGSNGFDQVVSRLNADLLDGNHASVFPQDASGVGTTIVGNWTFTPGSGGDFPLMPKNTFFNQADDGSTAPFQVTSTTVVANLESATTVMADDTKKFDGKLPGKYAILADDEIVTGDYTFEGEVDFSIEDAGKITMKSGALKIGPLAAAEAPFSLTAPYSGTIVTGLNVQYLNGSEDTAFIKPATATVAVTGNWTFNPSGTQPFTVPAGKTDLVERLNADLLDGEHAESFLTTASTDITITGNWFFNPASGGNFPNLPKQTYFSESSLAPFQVVSTAVVANLHATNSAQLGGTVADDYATDDEVDTLLISYANLSEDETVTGDYTFEGAVDFNPTLVADKITVKSGALKIGARATTEAPFTLTAPYSLTMVDGLNVQYLNGYQSSHFIRPETATVAVTGDWTFNPSGSQPFFVAAGKTDTVTNLSADTLRGSPPETFLQVATATPIITGNWTFNPTSDADFPYFGTNSNPQLPSGTKFYVADGTAPFEVTSTIAVANLHATNSDKLGGFAADDYATDDEVATLLNSYAKLSDNEAVTGDYTFTGDVTVGGGGTGLSDGTFTITSPAGSEAPIILENPTTMRTMVEGLNVQYLDGYQEASFLRSSATTVTITGNWTFDASTEGTYFPDLPSTTKFTALSGTPPFVVVSGDKIDNLHAEDSDKLGGYAASTYATDTEVSGLLEGYAELESAETILGLYAFNPTGQSVPFTVSSGKTDVVTNLNANRLGSKTIEDIAVRDEDEAIAGSWIFNSGGGTAVTFNGDGNSPTRPFILGSNATAVVGYLNASFLEGNAASSFLKTTDSPTITGTYTFSTPTSFTQSIGTSPFTVVSTTVVDNLNAQYVGGTDAAAIPNITTATDVTGVWSFSKIEAGTGDTIGIGTNATYPKDIQLFFAYRNTGNSNDLETIDTITTTTDTVFLVEATITAINDCDGTSCNSGDGACYIIRQLFKDDNGTVSAIGALDAVFTREEVGTDTGGGTMVDCSVTLGVLSDNILVQVKGITGGGTANTEADIKWNAVTKIYNALPDRQ